MAVKRLRAEKKICNTVPRGREATSDHVSDGNISNPGRRKHMIVARIAEKTSKYLQANTVLSAMLASSRTEPILSYEEAKNSKTRHPAIVQPGQSIS